LACERQAGCGPRCNGVVACALSLRKRDDSRDHRKDQEHADPEQQAAQAPVLGALLSRGALGLRSAALDELALQRV
jgi:hypothetical protein